MARTKAETEQLKDYAKLLYVSQRLTGKEVATRAGVSEQTISKWVNLYGWENLRTTLLVTRKERIQSTIAQLTELDNLIASREEKKRFPTREESLIRKGLIVDLANLETECGLKEIIDASIVILDWLRPLDPVKAKGISEIFDLYIKEHIQ